MNIFAVSPDPGACAQALDSRRLVKMVTETAKIICTVSGCGPYRPTHDKHPVIRWSRSYPGNYWWTQRLFLALGAEYSFRFNKVHGASSAMTKMFLYENSAEPYKFQNSAKNSELGLDFTHIRDTHEAYRAYLNARWALERARAAEPPREYFDGETIRVRPKYPAPTWGKRGAPEWAKIS